MDTASQPVNLGQPAGLEVVVTGVGAGASCVYAGQPSSSFVLRHGGQPVLLLDVGVGAVRACLQLAGSLPDKVFVTHNHTDHAGELPVLLAVEAARGHKMTVLAEEAVMSTLLSHRLHELQSTGRALSDFGTFISCSAGQLHQLGGGLSLLPLRSRHAERCFGLLLYHEGQPVLGFSGDSGYDAALYSALAAAPVLLLDGREQGGAEHAGFGQIAAAAASGIFGSSQVYVYGYGCLHEAAAAAAYPCLQVAVPGTIIALAGSQQQQQQLEAEGPAQQAALLGSRSTSAAAAAAAAEATAAASAAAVAAHAASVMNRDVKVAMQEAAAGSGAGAAAAAAAGTGLYKGSGAELAARGIVGWAAAVNNTAAVNKGDNRRSNGLQQQVLCGWGASPHPCEVQHNHQHHQDEEMLDGAAGGLPVPAAAADAVAASGYGCVAPSATHGVTGFPGVLQPKHRPQQQQQQQANQHRHQQQHMRQQRLEQHAAGQHAAAGDRLAEQQQQQQRRQAAGAAAVALARRQPAGVSSATSTSSCTAAL